MVTSEELSPFSENISPRWETIHPSFDSQSPVESSPPTSCRPLLAQLSADVVYKNRIQSQRYRISAASPSISLHCAEPFTDGVLVALLAGGWSVMNERAPLLTPTTANSSHSGTHRQPNTHSYRLRKTRRRQW